MRPRAFSFVFVCAAILGLFVACGGGAVEGSSVTAPTAPVTPVLPNGAQSMDASTDSAIDATLADATPPDAKAATTVGSIMADGGKLCGCSLCAPVVSEDSCSRDADCLPEVPCHATRCIAKAHATPRNPGLMCTEIMRCDSTDANACGCVKGKCTLSPR